MKPSLLSSGASMSRKKSWREKLEDHKGLPKLVKVEGGESWLPAGA